MQALRAPGNKHSLALSVVALLVIGYGLYFTHFVRVGALPVPLKKAGPAQFLTNISAHLTVHYFFLSVVAHATRSPRLFHFKNNYFLAVVISLEFIVTVVYWSLKLFFTHMILMVNNTSYRVDFCLHFFPFATLLADYLCFLPQFTISSGAAILLCGVLASAYWAWLDFLIDPELGQAYPYPFLNVETKKRAVIFASVAMLAFVGFTVIRKIYDAIVGITEVAVEKVEGTVEEHKSKSGKAKAEESGKAKAGEYCKAKAGEYCKAKAS